MTGPSRRGLITGAGALAFTGLSAAALPLFGTPDRSQDPEQCRATDTSGTDKRFAISNWPAYIDEDTKGYKSTLTRFEEKYGVTVDYSADVNDNVAFYGKVRNLLGSCQSTGRDMIVLSDWMAARMIDLGWIQKLDAAKVPNLHQNIISSLRAPAWDPNREYSAPWQAGFTGIAYNKTKVDEIRTVDELLTRADLKGRVSLLSEMRDTMGLVLLSDGADPGNFTQAQWETALEKIEKSRQNGQIRAFTGNEYLEDLKAGNVVACEAWSGDIAAEDDPDLVFVPPETGMMIWADNMLVPNLAEHLSIAEDWVNFYYDPQMAALLADYNWYVCPVEGAREQMKKIDPALVDQPLIFPTEEYLEQTHQFMALSESQIREYEGNFADVSGV